MESWVKNRVGLQELTWCTYNLTLKCVQVTVQSKVSKFEIFWRVFFCRICYETSKAHSSYYIFIWSLPPSAISFTNFKFGSVLEKNKENLFFLKLFTMFVWNISNFKKKWIAVMINESMFTIIKYRICLSYFKGTLYFSTDFFFRNIPILNFMRVRRVESDLLESKDYMTEQILCNFVILRTRLKLWLRFLVSFHTLTMKLLALTFN